MDVEAQLCVSHGTAIASLPPNRGRAVVAADGQAFGAAESGDGLPSGNQLGLQLPFSHGDGVDYDPVLVRDFGSGQQVACTVAAGGGHGGPQPSHLPGGAADAAGEPEEARHRTPGVLSQGERLPVVRPLGQLGLAHPLGGLGAHVVVVKTLATAVVDIDPSSVVHHGMHGPGHPATEVSQGP